MRRNKIISLVLAAGLLITFTGCEKKAENVASLGGSDELSAENVEENVTEEGSQTESSEEYENWNESLKGGDKGFDTVTIATRIKDYTEKEYSAVTVEFPTFDKNFIQETCETVFDSDDIEVYDSFTRTKRVWEDVLKTYEDAAELYDLYNSSQVLKAGNMNYYPDSYNVGAGNWEYAETTEEFSKDVIEENIEEIKKYIDTSPDSLVNDYSYMGYLGTIEGEEYYIYFGNRNYDSYMTSPETVQFNGRVVTIMKENIEEDYAGMDMAEILADSEYAAELPDDYDSVFYKTDSLIAESFGESLTGSNMYVDKNYIQTAEEFIGKLGYGDYEFCEDEIRNLYWGSSVSNGFIYINDYLMSPASMMRSDGYILRFRLNFENADRYKLVDAEFPVFSETGNTLDIDSYIDVMINANGIMCCQIYNPLKITKVNTVNNIIDTETIKEIVGASVDDTSNWNVPCYGVAANQNQKYVTIDEVKLINFPLRSSENSNEYTYVPCYMLFKKLWDDSYGTNSPFAVGNIIDTPFLLINAIDGSFVDAGAELERYPSGWKNDNVGYLTYYSGSWSRYIKYW